MLRGRINLETRKPGSRVGMAQRCATPKPPLLTLMRTPRLFPALMLRLPGLRIATSRLFRPSRKPRFLDSSFADSSSVDSRIPALTGAGCGHVARLSAGSIPGFLASRFTPSASWVASNSA